MDLFHARAAGVPSQPLTEKSAPRSVPVESGARAETVPRVVVASVKGATGA
jgi:hypothetical protein